MHHTIQYLNHLLRATNQHGVHSPFVYNYVTQCLYSKQRYCKEKSINILLKSIAYFEATSVLLALEDQTLKTRITEKFSHDNLQEAPHDIVLMNAAEQKNIADLFLNQNVMHNDSMLLVANIHQNKNNLKNWEFVKKHDKTTVTIDLFYCGVVFFRTEQAKEHFKIRI